MKTKTYIFKPKEWFTPNTFNSNFKNPTEKSGIYFIVRPIFSDFNTIEDYHILYIGSAKNLKNRYSSHEVYRVLSIMYDYLQFYFKETDNYKSVEKDLIRRLQPKFNTQWR